MSLAAVAGVGFAQDAQVAKGYLEKAEQLGNWKAPYLLAQLYLSEQGWNSFWQLVAVSVV
jgi:TPR repeat protein